MFWYYDVGSVPKNIRRNPGLWRFNLPGFVMFNLPASIIERDNVETWSGVPEESFLKRDIVELDGPQAQYLAQAGGGNRGI